MTSTAVFACGFPQIAGCVVGVQENHLGKENRRVDGQVDGTGWRSHCNGKGKKGLGDLSHFWRPLGSRTTTTSVVERTVGGIVAGFKKPPLAAVPSLAGPTTAPANHSPAFPKSKTTSVAAPCTAQIFLVRTFAYVGWGWVREAGPLPKDGKARAPLLSRAPARPNIWFPAFLSSDASRTSH
ncbi:hypothetical protein GQ53DRAFT_345454 [Thozetella sp. PMI_491]|nr:hypothetical protein GQ53DRAFT_345454 [Thozetella sp. PMI_491]